ncbi:hypothetical protein EHQ81_12055 [Leptospira selangorensis]|uniref:Uncharacterized protein n=1 Tax=Leptospira selangorensis TaxID=2484982 RepID=A0A5F2C1Y9_9LEPT|nr:hypothetical protein [Leptospira selangorensis]TGM12981.1 hypothetical protein EHQ81_12055 [Leptospira selangorensis]TGM21267.1 hypothetical protein EHQ82_09690 [Leptospira selangorensis]
MFRKIIPILIIISLNLNCVTFVFYPENFEKIPVKTVSPSHRKTIEVSILSKFFDDDIEEPPVLHYQKEAETMIKDSILKAGYAVTDTNGSANTADYYCEVIYTHKTYPHGGLNVISGFTLLLLPSEYSTNVTINFTFKDKNGKFLKSYQRSAETYNWLGWLFLPFMPFYFPTLEIDTMNFQLVGSILKEARKDNLLK